MNDSSKPIFHAAFTQETGRLRIQHAAATHRFRQGPEIVFNAFAGWAQYDRWAPAVQGAAHWLVLRRGGVGSRFILYDKPGPRHLSHFGEVTCAEPGRQFAWRAPFSEWPRVFVGTALELERGSNGDTIAHERLYFDVREDHLPALRGFLSLAGFDSASFEHFLATRLAGLGALLDRSAIAEEAMNDPFTEDRLVAADWAGRVSTGRWIRILYADGEVEFSAPPDVAFNVFTRFARYADWTRAIHVGHEWLEIKSGGIGSKFLLWEKPGDRQVMHWGVVTEMERNRRFAWRAPFADWGKVFLGTAIDLRPRSGGGTTAYHVLYLDLPEEYLAIFAGFGSLHGYDIEFETLHIHEEAQGIQKLLASRAFSQEEESFLFDSDSVLARDWPLQEGRPWPLETLTLRPDSVITYEDAIARITEEVPRSIPSPEFFRRYRDLERTRRFNPSLRVADAD